MAPTFLQKLKARNSPKQDGSDDHHHHHDSDNEMLTLGPEDVIVGRGKGAYLSAGNRKYMQVIMNNVARYQNASKSTEKAQITKEILDTVSQKGGRFLGIDGRGTLYEVSEKQARIKIGQVRTNRMVMCSCLDVLLGTTRTLSHIVVGLFIVQALRHKRRQLEGGSERSMNHSAASDQDFISEISDRSINRSKRGKGSFRSFRDSQRSVSQRSFQQIQQHQRMVQKQAALIQPTLSHRSAGNSYRTAGESSFSHRSGENLSSLVSERSQTGNDEFAPYVPRGVSSASALTPSLTEFPNYNGELNGIGNNNYSQQQLQAFHQMQQQTQNNNLQNPVIIGDLPQSNMHQAMSMPTSVLADSQSNVSSAPMPLSQHYQQQQQQQQQQQRQTNVALERASQAFSSMSLSASRTMQRHTNLEEDDEFALNILDDDDEFNDRLSEFSCLSLTESDRHDLGNMSD